MKIAFINGTLEPGKDGVGDYTRGMAYEMARNGHEVLMIAWNDKYTTNIEGEIFSDDSLNVSSLRIPMSLSSNHKFLIAKKSITDFNPEWISLQYVSFSFHKKGLHSGLADKLHDLGKGRKWHIMFHELWVGMNNESSMKLKLWGKLQRGFVARLVRTLKPVKTHTNTHLYQSKLKELNIKSGFLPLFGNIPVEDLNLSERNSEYIDFVVFGGIHAHAPIESFIKELSGFGQINEKKIRIKFIGRCGSQVKNWIDICKKEGLNYIDLGEQSVKVISKELQKSFCGIVTTPFLLVEKSGAGAAMIEHQLPVICVSPLWTLPDNINITKPDHVQLYIKNFFLNWERSTTFKKSNVSTVVTTLITDLYGKY